MPGILRVDAPERHQLRPDRALARAQAVEAFEHVTEPASARYDVAYVCMLDGKLAVAETLLHQAIKISPTYNADVKLLRKQRVDDPELRFTRAKETVPS